MTCPPMYNPVYDQHARLLPEPSLHANPLLQTPPIPHWEGPHTIHWLQSDPKRLSSTVLGDSLRFAFKGYDSGKLIPHLPQPLLAGPFLLDTLHGSQYQVLFHQPNVLLEGQPVGVFQWGVAPPWRCIELKLPLPRFLGRAGRAAAARASNKRLEAAVEALSEKEKAEQAWAAAESLEQAMNAVERKRLALQEEEAAERQLMAALSQEDQRLEHERHARLFDEEAEALTRKREADRLRRRGLALAERQDQDALASAERGVQGPLAERREALDLAADQRARATATRAAAEAWAVEAREQEAIATARRKAAIKERAALRSVEEARARARGGKKENPSQQATGESNASFLAPSLLAHLPFPGTVEIQVSWGQIGKTWSDALVGAAAAALKYYVGFVVDGVLVPGKGKVAAVLLDLVKSAINDALIDCAAKFLTEGTWQVKLSTKLGPVKFGLQCEPDAAAGASKWQGTLESTEASSVLPLLKPKLSIEGHGFRPPEKASLEVADKPVREEILAHTPVDYAHGVPAVN